MILSLVNGCRAIDRKRRLSPGLLFSGFRHRPVDLVLAGFCNFVVLHVILLCSYPIDNGTWWKFLVQGVLPDSLVMNSKPFMIAILVFGGLLLFWGMACVFVPQLIGWWRLSVQRAISFSFRGCLRNWLAMLVYTVCFTFFIVILASLVINLVAITTEGLGVIACFAFLLVMFPVVFASFYVAARDIYGFPRRRKHHRVVLPTAADAPSAEKMSSEVRASE